MSVDVARAEWRRANECLTAALLCLNNGLNADAISRAYYAVMHAAKAALEIRDVSADSHQGVRNQFGLHIVRPGLVEPAWGSEIGNLRALLDRRVICDLLGFDESVYEAVRRLSAKWCAEPSVHGGKKRPKGAGLVI